MEHIAVEVEVTELVHIAVEVLLDVQVCIGVVLCDGNAIGSFGPCDHHSFGVARYHDGFHALAKLDAVEHEVHVVVLEKDLGVAQHRIGGWTFCLGKLHHLGFVVVLDVDLAHSEGSVWSARFHHFLHGCDGLFGISNCRS